MLCVLFLRSTVPRSSWGDNPGSISYSIYLTKWVTHNPSTAVRATTSLRGERAQQAAYSLPSPWAASRRERLRLCTQSACRFSLIAHRTSLQYGKYSCVSSARSEEKSADAFCAQSLCAAAQLFSRALFSTTLPTLVENECSSMVSTISVARFHSLAFCAASWKCAALGAAWRGMGKEESGGLGEKTRKGKGDCSRAAPLSPGCLPKTPVDGSCVTYTVHQMESRTSLQASGKPVLRDPSG